MILIHPDTWLEHWQERKQQQNKDKEKDAGQLKNNDGKESPPNKTLVECDDLFICVDTQLATCVGPSCV